MMTSYQLSERVNAQVILWAAAGFVYRVAVVMWFVIGWLWAAVSAVAMMAALVAFVGAVAVGKWLITHRAAILAASKVLAITVGWGAVIVAAVVISALYWHLLLALGGLALVAWATYPRSGSRQSRA